MLHRNLFATKITKIINVLALIGLKKLKKLRSNFIFSNMSFIIYCWWVKCEKKQTKKFKQKTYHHVNHVVAKSTQIVKDPDTSWN